MSDAGRVIAGSARGIRLRAPGAGTRPLADRVKQTLFAILEPDLRGAARARPVRRQRRGRDRGAVARRGVGDLRREGPGRRLRHRGEPAGDGARRPGRGDRPLGRRPLARPSRSADEPFDIVLVDPPYAETELLGGSSRSSGSPDAPLAPGARVVAKHFWRDRPPDRIGLLASERDRRFGETALTFYRREEDR